MDRKIGIMAIMLMLGLMFGEELMVLSAQTTDTDTQPSISEKIDEKVSETNDEQQLPAEPISRMSDANIQRLIDEKVDEKFHERSGRLDDRAESVNWWLEVLGIVVAFFGVVIPILIAVVTIFSLKKFQKLEAEARDIIGKVESEAQKSKDEVRQILTNARKEEETIKEHSNRAKEIVDNLSGLHKLTGNIRTPDQEEKKTEILASQTGRAWAILDTQEEAAARISQEVLKDTEATIIDRAVAEACLLQQDGKIEEAIRKWESIANTVEGSEKDIAARAWFSSGNLLSKAAYMNKHFLLMIKQSF